MHTLELTFCTVILALVFIWCVAALGNTGFHRRVYIHVAIYGPLPVLIMIMQECKKNMSPEQSE